MSSRIEEMIDQIESYIDSCRPSALSHDRIIVNRGEMEALIRELRAKTPEEIKRYEKMLENKDAILSDARAKAKALIDEATEHTNALINENEIKRQAYDQANQVVATAAKQAQEILDKATADANEMTASAVRYTDDLLQKVEEIVNKTLDAANIHYGSFSKDLMMYSELIKSNREDLRQTQSDASAEAPKVEMIVQPAPQGASESAVASEAKDSAGAQSVSPEEEVIHMEKKPRKDDDLQLIL